MNKIHTYIHTYIHKQTAYFNILKFLAGAIFCLSTFLATPMMTQAEEYKWIGGGNENNPIKWDASEANWSPNGLPGLTKNVYTDIITIDSGYVDGNLANYHHDNDTHFYYDTFTIKSGGTFCAAGGSPYSSTVPKNLILMGNNFVIDGGKVVYVSTNTSRNFRLNGTSAVLQNNGSIEVDYLYLSKGTFEIKQGTVNVSGNSGSGFRTATNTTLKFTANDFNGTAKMFSTINVTNKAEINGNVTVDMGDYFNGDVIYVTGDLTQMLIDAKTLANFTESSLKDCVLLPDWKVQASDDSSDLVLKYTGSVAEVGSLQDFDGGWVKVSGDANSTIDFTMEYTNDLGTAETFVDWLNASAEMQGYEGAVALSETVSNSIVFSDLLLDANGVGHLYLDYGAYNSYHHEAFPEPSTWAMLAIGVGALVLGRRKR